MSKSKLELEKEIELLLRENKKLRDQLNIKTKGRLKKVYDELPEDVKNIVKYSDKKGRIIYDINEVEKFKKCNKCGEYKTISNYIKSSYKYGDGFVNSCKKCTRETGRKGKPRHGNRRLGEMYKGKIIKKFDERGTTTHVRCTSCDEFKLTKQYDYRYRNSGVCKDCFIKIPGNHLTRKGEFTKDKDGKKFQIRIYDEITYLVSHKRCSKCKTMKELDQFNKRSGDKIDGRSGICRVCFTTNYSKKELMIELVDVRVV